MSMRSLFVLALAVAAQQPAASLAGPCGSPATPIHAIQGSGSRSPLVGEVLEVEGVVVGSFPGLPAGLGGFFLQEETADADTDPATSEGLFVFDVLAGDVRRGDTVRMRGEVREFFGLTELGRLEEVARCPRRGGATAAVVHLPVDDVSDWERWEGMRVRIVGPLVISGAHDLARYGELTLAAGGRLWQPTQRVAPGDAARWVAWDNARRRLLLDDGSEVWRPGPPPWLETPDGETLRVGDCVTRLEGVVDFAFGAFRIQPTAPVRIRRAAPRPTQPPPVRGALRVASFNVENFFNGDGRGGGFPSRGAADPGELVRQREKLVALLAALDADVLALVELENDGVGPGSAVRELADALARRTGVERTIVDPGPGTLGGHAIAVALLYRPDRVALVGRPAVLGAGVDPDFDATRNRPVLAASFRRLAGGERFSVAVNHWKSKGSPCPGDPDRGDGQGECSQTRRRAARAVAAWLAGDPTGAGDAPALLLGDLNAYPNEDALAELADAGLVDLLAWFVGPDAYSYVFDGAAGRLDHAFAAPALLPRVGGAAVWHVNADAPTLLDYRAENPPELYRPDPFRASDHDPVLVGLFPGAEPESVRPSRSGVGGCGEPLR